MNASQRCNVQFLMTIGVDVRPRQKKSTRLSIDFIRRRRQSGSPVVPESSSISAHGLEIQVYRAYW